MTWRLGRSMAICLALLIGGCSRSPAASPSAPATSPASAAAGSGGASAGAPAIEGAFDVGGYRLWITCAGEGSPTVVFDAGLGSTSSVWDDVRDGLAGTTRTCAYDRAGLGRSDPRPDRNPRTVGAMAHELWRLLAAAGVGGPIVLAGHSHGGMIVRLLAHDHPDVVRGLVLVDAATLEKFEGQWFGADAEAATPIDRSTSAAEMAAVTTLGDIPLVVLTQGQMSGTFVSWWSGIQDGLAALSRDSLHMVARESDHDIPGKAAGLVAESARAVVETVRTGSKLPSCGPRFEAVGAECLKTTMTAQVDTWQRLRAAVQPVPGAFPTGTFRSELTGAGVAALTGTSPGFAREVLTWTFQRGEWSAAISDDGGSPDTIADRYQATGDEITIRLPDDWTIPRTPGVNRLHWTVDPDGTIHLIQIDDEIVDPSFTGPLLPVRAP